MDLFVVLYAILVAAGGVFGFLKTGSAISLIMGLTFGGLVTLFEYNRQFWMVFATCATLGVIMGYRALNSGKFMPAGLVSLLSGLLIVSLLVRNVGN